MSKFDTFIALELIKFFLFETVSVMTGALTGAFGLFLGSGKKE